MNNPTATTFLELKPVLPNEFIISDDIGIVQSNNVIETINTKDEIKVDENNELDSFFRKFHVLSMIEYCFYYF